MPNKPATPTRSIRIPDKLWNQALRKSIREGTTVSAVVVAALEAFVAGRSGQSVADVGKSSG